MCKYKKEERWDDMLPSDYYLEDLDRNYLNGRNDLMPFPPSETTISSRRERLADWLVLCLKAGFIDNKNFNHLRDKLDICDIVPAVLASCPTSEEAPDV